MPSEAFPIGFYKNVFSDTADLLRSPSAYIEIRRYHLYKVFCNSNTSLLRSPLVSIIKSKKCNNMEIVGMLAEWKGAESVRQV